MALPTLIEVFTYPDSGKEEYFFDGVPGSLPDTLFVSIKDIRAVAKAFNAGYNVIIFPIENNLVIYEKLDSLALIKSPGEFCVRLAYQIHNETDKVICRVADEKIEIQPAAITRQRILEGLRAKCLPE